MLAATLSAFRQALQTLDVVHVPTVAERTRFVEANPPLLIRSRTFYPSCATLAVHRRDVLQHNHVEVVDRTLHPPRTKVRDKTTLVPVSTSWSTGFTVGVERLAQTFDCAAPRRT